MILETFDGFVDCIKGETAYVTLKSEHGDTLYGEYSAEELSQLGIKEHRRFICRIIECGGTRVELGLEPVPEKEISPEEQMQIFKEIEELLGNDNEPQNDH